MDTSAVVDQHFQEGMVGQGDCCGVCHGGSLAFGVCSKRAGAALCSFAADPKRQAAAAAHPATISLTRNVMINRT